MIQLLRRLLSPSPAPFDAEPTAGGDPTPTTAIVDGWHRRARRVDAHPGRVGRAIRPWAVVLHETAMHPDSEQALVRRTARVAGAGNCYHFLVGRAGDLTQLVSITRNANHAGGPGHGWIASGRRQYHPNLVSVGIEVHSAGRVDLVDGQWRTLGRDGLPVGRPIPYAEVEVDRRRTSRGVQRPTPAQVDAVDTLLRELTEVLDPAPEGTLRADRLVHPMYSLGRARLPIFTHRELDPDRRSDPSEPLIEALRLRGW